MGIGASTEERSTEEEKDKTDKTDLEVRRVLALESVADSMEALVSKTLFKRR